MRLIGDAWSQKQFVTEDFPISNFEGWQSVEIRKPEKIYTIHDAKYVTLAKKERYLPIFTKQRIANILEGLFFSVVSLGLAPMLSKSVRQKFSGRQTLKITKKNQA